MKSLNANQVLRDAFAERKSRNSAYSTHAFARDLGLSQTYVSLLLNDKRRLTLAQVARITTVLKLSSEQSKQLIKLVSSDVPHPPLKTKRRGVVTNALLLNMDQLHTISRWYHLAVLDLATTKDFKNDAQWIAKRLGISSAEARDAVDRLIRLGLLVEKNSKLVKKDQHIFFKSDESTLAARTHHEDMMKNAVAAMKDLAGFHKRSITSQTIAIDSKKIKKAQKMIDEFKKKLIREMSKDDCDEVYQLNIQWFPLTKQEKNK